MKRFKKFVAAVSACALCFSLTQLNPAVNAASNTYLRGDINQDGKVNLTDSLSLSLFLRGEARATDANLQQRLDVNQDRLVDESDRQYILDIIGHSISSCIDTYSTGNTFVSPKSVLYHVYDGQQNYLLSKYMISAPSKITTMGYSMPENSVPNAPNPGNTESIIGNDDRYSESGYRGIVKVSNSLGCGTAFVIDDHTLLTAAHVVAGSGTHTTSNGGWEYNVNTNNTLTFYDQSNNPSWSIKAKTIHIPEEYLENRNSEFDYALITVDNDLSQYVEFKLGVANKNITNSPSIPGAYVTGFGYGRNNSQVNQNLVGIKSTGYGEFTNITDRRLKYTIDTINGDSGSPVYVRKGSLNTVVAIHTNGSGIGVVNSGTLITPYILQFVYNNPNL